LGLGAISQHTEQELRLKHLGIKFDDSNINAI